MGLLRTGLHGAGVLSVAEMATGALGAASTYADKVFSYGPIAYWMLAEAAGVTAVDQINSPAQDGTHVGVTLGQSGIGDGRTCPLYDGVNDYTNVYTVTFRDAFDGDLGSYLVWMKVSGVGVWTDGGIRYCINVDADDTRNTVRIFKSSTNNRLEWGREGANTYQKVQKNGVAETGWICLGLTWNVAADELKAYYNGVQEGLTQAGNVAWEAVTPNLARTIIGALRTAPTSLWDGYLAHVAVWDSVLNDAAMADLANI